LYFSPKEFRRMSREGHAAHLEGKRNAYRVYSRDARRKQT
jgi:hypothetical protein